jgi:phosphoglycerol transferase MdoB-like AlkP superfamily enzyme
MWQKIFPDRFALLKTFILIFLILSFLVRVIFLIWSFGEIDTSFTTLLYTFGIGFLFDLSTVSFFALPYSLYLLLLPQKFHGSLVDKSITYFAYTIGLVIFLFSFFAEITFWDEFKNRFNFIAVDYLIYSYEVVKNINESYPIPYLIGLILIAVGILILITFKKSAFAKTFKSTIPFKAKMLPFLVVLCIGIISSLWIKNKQAEQFTNRYNNELSKAGIFSFFAAFRNNELSFEDFYKTINNDKAFDLVKASYNSERATFLNPKDPSIFRTIQNTDSLSKPLKPNVIFICIESLSGKYLNSLGGDYNITPTLDSLANNSLFFTNLYATGTRTVRGMEAITLSIPPTQGRSIVKRTNNTGLFTIGEVFKNKGYSRNFFYGGDGYFDNMNTYFGGNGFNIVDRGRGFLLDKEIKTTRTNIEDDEVTFENAWGVCDEDIYRKVIKEADMAHQNNEPFFDFVMTTSNHKPYTYPEEKIDIPSGTSRQGAIKYTDLAIAQFLKMAKTRPWFKNTIIVIMSDHCASSAGKGELDINNYHIPAMICNLQDIAPQKINKLCSQIDMFPTVFSLLNWDYTSNLFGKDIFNMKLEDERAFIGNYRKLGLLKGSKVMVLGDQKKANFYEWNSTNNNLSLIATDTNYLDTTIAFYQVANYLYSHNGLKTNQ